MQNVKNSYAKIFSKISKEYDKNLDKYGNSPKSVGQLDVKTLEKRLSILAEVGELKNAKILDFGCGIGFLYSYLKKKMNFKGEYVGYDISNKMINFARKKYKNIRFENKDILSRKINERFDYVILNGTFNNKLDQNFNWMKKTLKILFKKTNKAIAFNNITSYVDYFDKKLYYTQPEKIFNFCKSELSPLVSLRHDYLIKNKKLPYEFTTYVYQTKIKKRKSLIKSI